MREGAQIEVFLAHPGGPFWASRDAGAWTIPKGAIEVGEEALEAAIREFGEETSLTVEGPFVPLGQIVQKAGKVVHGWACEADLDPALVKSNTVRTLWPPGSGDWIQVPEIDRCEWFDPETARWKINAAQVAFIDRLEDYLRKES